MAPSQKPALPLLADTASALGRLDLSRQHLRQGLKDISGGDAAKPHVSDDWLADLKALPGYHLVHGALRAWWEQHPLQNTLQPLARRHPLALVAAALAAGGLATCIRPWRWLPAHALLAGLGPVVGAQLLNSLLGASKPSQAPGKPL